MDTDSPAPDQSPGLLRASIAGDWAGVSAVALATVLWSTTGALVKWVTIPALVISFYRLVLSVPILVVMVKGRRNGPKAGPLRPAVVGGLLFALHQLTFFSSLKMTTIANVTLIGALQPAVVALVAKRFIGERVRRSQPLWIGLAIVGVALAVLASVGTPAWSPVGDLLAVANLLIFTAYFLVSKEARNKLDTPRYNLVMTATAAVVISIITVATWQPVVRQSAKEWAVLVFIAAVPGTMGHLLVNWAHPRVTAAVSSTILLGVPILSIAFGIVLVGDRLGWLGWVGCGLTLVSIWAVVRQEAEEAEVSLGSAEVDETEFEAAAT